MSETIKTYAQIRNEFFKTFTNKIVPIVQQYEKERKITLTITLVIAIPLVILALGLIYITFTQSFSDDMIKLDIFCCTLPFLVYHFFKKDFENKIKSKVMPNVCKCYNNLTWNEGGYQNNSTLFSASNLVYNFDKEVYDDVFIGKHKNVKFDIVETKLTKGSGREKETVFKGVIIVLDMNKNFKGNTIIRPDTILHKSPFANLRHTTLEDVVFEKKFDVYTDDEVEARYLITTAFMERLNNIKVTFEANNISCAFYQNKLLIGIDTQKDLFSLCSLFKPVDDAKQYYQMFEEILSIIKLIDYFKLDQKIGL